MPATVTVPNVQLVRAGTWHASTGVTRVTVEDLDAMVAAEADPGVLPAVVKLGHVDPRFDGEPAYGWARNLRRVGEVLVGDLADVPAGLAAILPAAFRHRSVEIAWGVRTPDGTRHRAALAGVALLGTQPPAVAGLADIEALYRTAAAGAGAGEAQSVVVLAVAGDGAPLASGPASTAPPTELDQGWQALATLAGALVRAEAAPVGQTVLDQGPRPPEDRVDDRRIRELLDLAQRQGSDAAVAALRQEVAAPAAPVGQAPQTGQAAPSTTTTTPSTAGTAPASSTIPQQGAGAATAPAGPASGTAPTPTGQQAGAPPAGAATTAPAPGTGAAPAPTTTQPSAPTSGATAPAQGAQAAPAGIPGVPPGMTVVSAEVLAELQRNAEAGARAAQTLDERDLERELATAFAGRWAPAERPSLLTWLSTDPVSARANLSARPIIVPTTELGTDQGPSAEADDAAWSRWEAEVGLRDPLPEQTTTTGGNA
jgi:hypothetical protein